MENGHISAVDSSEDPKPSMALAGGIQDDVIGSLEVDPIESTDEALGLQSDQWPKVEDHSQENCMEKLEVDNQSQELPSSIITTIGTEKSNGDPEKKPSLSKPKTNQKLDTRGIINSSTKIATKSPTTGGISIKRSTREHCGALNPMPSQTSKESVDTKQKSLNRSNGDYSSFSEAGKVSETLPSASRLSLKQAYVRKSHSNFTVPQPFALATDKRASLGGQLQSGGKVYVSSRSFNSKQNIREIERKGSDGKGEDMKYPEPAKHEETKPQSKSSASTFNFNSDVRAARRKEFNSKKEERLTAREAEKTEAQAKTKEEIQAEIKQFRKSLTFKATRMPAFYQDANPPVLEFKKIPPTRARSPKLGRRNSITGTGSQEGMHAGQSPPNQNAKENSGLVKVSKPSSRPQDLKKPSQKTHKQESGPNAPSQRAVPQAPVNETLASIGKTSAHETNIEIEEHISEVAIPSADIDSEEACVHSDNREPADGQLYSPKLST